MVWKARKVSSTTNCRDRLDAASCMEVLDQGYEQHWGLVAGPLEDLWLSPVSLIMVSTSSQQGCDREPLPLFASSDDNTWRSGPVLTCCSSSLDPLTGRPTVPPRPSETWRWNHTEPHQSHIDQVHPYRCVIGVSNDIVIIWSPRARPQSQSNPGNTAY